ncbi:MAG: 1-acyl-sn-glycerol-3-phosphate acyltransferase [Endomicrobia bacterium]|nr:1-acyl-sn-glycerol-3-phosphate acyltransferase [Endomicrobiia bacterium]MCX7715923.1 1-acyl-sn-glycerol-3-phosphate acyltransferase [Endomicrobiia bacterium]
MNIIAKIFSSVYFYFCLFQIILSAFIELILQRYNWHRYVFYSKKIFDLVKKTAAKVYIENLDELKKVKPPVIIISNHMSSIETFIFGYLFGQFFRITFVVKKSLLYYPIFGSLLRFLQPIPVSRKSAKKDFDTIIRKLKVLFRKNISLVIFPQATRSYKIEEKNFNSIGVKLAKMFKVDIIPVCVKTDFLSIGKVFKDFGKVFPEKTVYVKVFPLIDSQHITKDTHRKMVNLLKQTIDNWQQQS